MDPPNDDISDTDEIKIDLKLAADEVPPPPPIHANVIVHQERPGNQPTVPDRDHPIHPIEPGVPDRDHPIHLNEPGVPGRDHPTPPIHLDEEILNQEELGQPVWGNLQDLAANPSLPPLTDATIALHTTILNHNRQEKQE